MSATTRVSVHTPVSVLAARIILVLVACLAVGILPYLYTGESTEIVTYSAPKEVVRKPPAVAPEQGKPARLWGAIVPLKSELWFFKVTGPVEAVAQREPELREFLQTVTFERELPTWKLPAEWSQKPGNDIRFATILIPADEKPLELTVIKLPRGDGPLDTQVLDNVNRWREQVALPRVKPEELSGTTEKMTVADVESTLVSLVGVAQASSMGRPPFAPR